MPLWRGYGSEHGFGTAFGRRGTGLPRPSCQAQFQEGQVGGFRTGWRTREVEDGGWDPQPPGPLGW